MASNAAILDSLIANEQRQRALMLASAASPLSRLGASPAALMQHRHFLGGGIPALAPADPLGLSLPFGLDVGRTRALPYASALDHSSDSSLLLGQQQAQAAALSGLTVTEHHREQMILDAMERAQSGRNGRAGTFPRKLHQMLADLENEDGGTAIASYLPHGRAFVIHNPNEFVKKIMPNYFRMSRFSSFQRQLNLYEFVRITDGPDKGAYYHDLFIRGRPILASQIRRNKLKGSAVPTTAKKDSVAIDSEGENDEVESQRDQSSRTGQPGGQDEEE